MLLESQALRVARATVHAQRTLQAGFTTTRDLGSEGAGFADVGLKQAINQDIIPGPRLLVATRALVATGSYGPKLSADEDVPQGAQEADGVDGIIRAVREQIGKGADLIKVYADYRWGADGSAQPTFSQEELTLIVQTARSAGARGGSPRQHPRGHAPRHRGRRGNHRAWRRRHTRNIQADEAARRGPVPHRGRRRCRGAVPGLAQRAGARLPPASCRSTKASKQP